MRLQDIGCICCRIEGQPSDVHHLVDRGSRAASGGDYATVPLCEWHHRGVPRNGLRPSEALFHFGPSLALQKRLFIRTYGTERELLAKVEQKIAELEDDYMKTITGAA